MFESKPGGIGVRRLVVSLNSFFDPQRVQDLIQIVDFARECGKQVRVAGRPSEWWYDYALGTMTLIFAIGLGMAWKSLSEAAPA